MKEYGSCPAFGYQCEYVAKVEAQAAEIEKLRDAVSILEDALQQVGDNYPGSKMQEWCQYMVSCARAALGETK